MTEPLKEAQGSAPAAPPAGSRAREVAAVAAIVLILVAVALAALWPWRESGAAQSATLARYAPSFDGSSTLNAKLDANGSVALWQSVNRKHLQSAAAYATEINPAQRQAVESLYATDDATPPDDFVALLAGAQLIHERVTELDTRGGYTETLNLRLRNPQGEFVVALNADDPRQQLVFTPPLHALPAELRAGERWEGAGRIGAQAAYTITGEVTEADPYRGALGEFDDCVLVKNRFVISLAEQTLDDRRWADTYCAGVGLAAEVEVAAATGAETRWVALASNGENGGAAFLASLPTSPPAPAPPDIAPRDEWQLTRTGRYASGIDTAATIAPVYLPNPPALLVASHDGDLIALDASSGFADPIWRFSPGGTVFGRPAVDAQQGRIYFGASDKRLYALDSRGLFLWSFLTGDNVATQPVVFEDLVIFGSEDRNIYAVESADGELRWQRETGAAVVASPALALTEDGEPVVIAGSDDGVAYGLDARSGGVLWRYESGKPIEAPVLVVDGVAFVTSTAGSVSALDPLTGEEQWVASVSERPVRFAPAVAADRLVVVDQQGYASAYSLAGGRRLWQSIEFDYLGAPLLVGERLYVAGSGGVVHELDLEGRRVETWRMAGASDVTDGEPRLDFGPVAGGGAIWTVDSRSVVRRIGGAVNGPGHIPLGWVRQVNQPPFAMDLLKAAPVRWGDSALAIDEGGRLVELDPATGAVSLKAESGVEAARIEPAPAGDLLILTNANGLTAIRPADGDVAWQAEGGTTTRPPLPAGDTLLWSAATADGSGARLAALNAITGEEVWAREFPGIAVPGGLVAEGASVWASAPLSRLDRTSGETVWEASELTGGAGSPALSPDGEVVYVGRLDALSGGEVVALDADTGDILWRSPLGQRALSFLEQPWVSGDVLVVPTLDGGVLGLDRRTGAVVWDAALPAARFGALTVDGGRAYMALTDGQVVALDTSNGEIVARGGDREGGLEAYGFAQRPLLIGDRLIVSFGSALRGYSLAELAP